ncbi:MAG: hypothetical protein J6A22_03625 [Bacteroidales bacterium]|nr:hypothetical protein [Bacteroidales bacterium]
MKKLFSIATVFAVIFSAISCQKESASISDETGLSEVAFLVDLPVEAATKAIADGTTATELYYAVFNENGSKYLQSLAMTQPVAIVGKTAEVKLKLVRNYTYQIVFWAQSPDAPYTFDPATATLKVDYAGDANDEDRDAFCKLHTFKVPDQATFNETVVLTRPFAQINFGSADYASIDELDLDMVSTVYVEGLYDTYNILTGAVSGSAATSLKAVAVPEQWNPAEDLNVNGQDYGYVAMAYVLALENEYDANGDVIRSPKELANIKATFTYAGSDVVVEVPNVPYQRNFRTNIIGNFFTDEVTFNIVIDEHFYEPPYVLNKIYETVDVDATQTIVNGEIKYNDLNLVTDDPAAEINVSAAVHFINSSFTAGDGIILNDNATVVLQDCNFTIPAGKKVVVNKTSVTTIQVMYHNVRVNGVLVTKDNWKNYFEAATAFAF